MNYLLRAVPDDLWRKVKSKAALEGLSMRAAIVQMLKDYVTRKGAN